MPPFQINQQIQRDWNTLGDCLAHIRAGIQGQQFGYHQHVQLLLRIIQVAENLLRLLRCQAQQRFYNEDIDVDDNHVPYR